MIASWLEEASAAGAYMPPTVAISTATGIRRLIRSMKKGTNLGLQSCAGHGPTRPDYTGGVASERQIHVGGVPIGGGAPVAVQTMTKTETADLRATMDQISRVADAGADIVRVAVPREKDVEALKTDRAGLADPGDRRHPLQLHAGAQGARCRRALRAAEPGQHRRARQGGAGHCACDRVGRAAARGGELGLAAAHLRQLEYDDPVEALVTAAVETVELMERLDFRNFKVSMKSTSVPNTIAANRLLAERIPYPLHLGVTEAGTKWSGSLKSAVGLGTLLADGIGDTIRISLSTFHAEEEVKVAWEILKALKLRERGPVLIACPTCGRLQFDMDSVVAEVERRLESYEDPIEVSVLGCAVNGIGEARHADFGITGAKDMGMIYSRGEPLKKVPTEQLVDELFAEIDRYYEAGKQVVRDEARAAEARQWLSENEDEHCDDARAHGRDGKGRRSPRRGRLAGGGPPLHPRLSPPSEALSRPSRLGPAGRRVRGRRRAPACTRHSPGP